MQSGWLRARSALTILQPLSRGVPEGKVRGKVHIGIGRPIDGRQPAAGADAWQLSNPPILSMAPLRASLELFREAGMTRLRSKSMQMTAYLLKGINSQLGDRLEIISPAEPQRRGCQLSIRVRAGHEKGRQLFRYLEQNGVLTDWREPDVIRVAPAPLYNRFEDCFQLLSHMSDWSESIDNPGYGSVS